MNGHDDINNTLIKTEAEGGEKTLPTSDGSDTTPGKE